MEAAAITLDKQHFLALFNIETEFNRRQSTLQVARELLISNDKIIEQHELLRERIDALSQDAMTQHQLQMPVRQLIEDAEFGVAIVDQNLQTLEQNPALFRLFEKDSSDSQDPAKLVLNLCQRQFPEFNRILETASRWSGELYWLKPPALSRWMQVSISPILSELQTPLYWVILLTDVTREKYLQQSNERLTYFDVLTELPNRYYLWQSLESAIRAGAGFYFIQINVKNLKRINEVYGHPIGDEVLLECVGRLKALLNKGDMLARIGGNEFAVILRESEQLACQQVANEIIAAMSEPVYVLDSYKCNVGMGLGAAQYPRDGRNAEDLLRYADLAAYTAKHKAKSSFQFYSTELKENSRKRIELESALRDAVEGKQFELFLQPILELESQKIVKAEALIRWRRPGVGLVPPDQFIPVAEQTGLIVPIGKWVIEQAIRLLAQLNKQQTGIRLSINVSPVQVSDRNLLEHIQQCV